MVDRPSAFEADKAINETDECPAIARADQLAARVPHSDQLGQRRYVAVMKDPHLLLEILHDPQVVDALNVFDDDCGPFLSIAK
jgi:hypothetical protein